MIDSPLRARALASKLGFLLLALIAAVFLLAPSVVAAADAGPIGVNAKGSGKSGSGSGSSGSGNSGSKSDDSKDDKNDDKGSNSGSDSSKTDDSQSSGGSGSSSSSGSGSSSSGNSGSGNSGSGSSGSGNSGSGSSGSGSSGSGNSGSGNSGSGSSGSGSSGSGSSGSGSSGSGSSGGSSSSSGGQGGSSDDPSDSRSTRERIEGKTRALINGFQAEFSVRLETRFDRVKFRAEASSLNLGAGTSLAVCFDGASLGGITLNALNFGELELDSRRGQSIPDFAGGETIELRDGSCGGSLILSATLGSTQDGGTPPPTNDLSRIEGKARRLINGFEAEFSVRLERRADRDKFRAEAKNLDLGAGTRLDVCFAGQSLGDIFLNSFNFGELELDSRLGQSFPIFENGDTVELRRGGCGGELLLAATFGGNAAAIGLTAGGGSGEQPNDARTEIAGKSRRVINGFEAEFSVRFEQRFDRAKIRAEASNLNLDPGTDLTVCFNGSALGRVRLNAIHFAELELDSRLGHSVPILQSGDVVALHQGASCSGLPALISATIAPADD